MGTAPGVRDILLDLAIRFAKIVVGMTLPFA